MKFKKLLTLILTTLMLLGTMSINVFAGPGLDEITLDQTAVTLVVGGTKTLTPTVKFEGNDVTATYSSSIQWSSTEKTVAIVENGVVTAVKEGTTTIKADCEGYSATCTVTVISGIATLDLDTNSSKEIDQNYTLTQDGDTTYTDVTKVKLEWTISDIVASYTSNKTWDPDSLTWKETKTVADISDKTAEFSLTNYSSKKVIGTVSFKVEDTLEDTLTSATFDDNNGKEIDTVVNSDHTIDETKKTNVPSNKITATLKFNADKFAELNATTTVTKYGTYTIAITETPAVTANYLTFTANQDNSSVTPNFASGVWQYSTDGGSTWNTGKSYQIKRNFNYETLETTYTYKYSTNGVDWIDADNENDIKTVIDLNKDESVMLKGTNCMTGYDESFENLYKFSMTGSISASGDVTSLTNGVGGDINLTDAYPYNAENIADVHGCYQRMFDGCSSLTTAPNLPSSSLSPKCYYEMFNGCTSLASAPMLAATTLVRECYYGMFVGCSSLANAPELSATALAYGCYTAMFRNCTALTTAPTLSVKSLKDCDSCYSAMFEGCINLITAPALNAENLTDYCYSAMFSDCTSLISAPALSAETLAEGCYRSMFYGCTSLTSAPALPATTLTDSCYESMFFACTSLKIGESADSNVANKIFTCPNVADGTYSVSGMFEWTSGTFANTPNKDKTYYWYTE